MHRNNALLAVALALASIPLHAQSVRLAATKDFDLQACLPDEPVPVTHAFAATAHGLYFLSGGNSHVRRTFYALRAGLKGEIKPGENSGGSIAWQSPVIKPHIVTPIVYGDYLYVATDNGVLTQYQAKTGEPGYRARLGNGGSFSSSPVAADGKLYFANEDGDVFVVKVGSAYELLARNSIGEVVIATPAISGRMIIIRGQNHVFGIKESNVRE